MKRINLTTFRAAYNHLKTEKSAWVNFADIKALCKRK